MKFSGILIGLFLAVFLGAADIRIIVVQGFGDSHESALKDAFRAAVEQTAGVLIKSEVEVKNDKLVKEKIITHSSGFVDRYEILKKTQPSAGGVYSVTIRAYVGSQKLIKFIKNVTSSRSGLENMQDVWARIESGNDRKESAEKYLIHLLSGLRKYDFLEPVLIDSCGRRGSSAVPLVLPTNDRNKVVFSIGAVVQFNYMKFAQEKLPELTRSFEKLCAESSEIVLRGVPGRARKYFHGFDVNRSGIMVVSSTPRKKELVAGETFYLPGAWGFPKHQRMKYVGIILEKQAGNGRKKVIRYAFHKTKNLTNFLKRCAGGTCYLTLLLKDKEGKVLAEYSRALFSAAQGLLFHTYSLSSVYAIRPEIRIAHHRFSRTMPVVFNFTMNTSDVKNIRSMELLLRDELPKKQGPQRHGTAVKK